jgi:hypothetical protein
MDQFAVNRHRAGIVSLLGERQGLAHAEAQAEMFRQENAHGISSRKSEKKWMPHAHRLCDAKLMGVRE